MENEELDNQESLNSDEGEGDNSQGDDLTKAQDYAKNQKIRAEKAETELKRLKAEVEAKKPRENETPTNDYSLKDYRALSDVHDDDVDDIIDYAKWKKISIAEAKKSLAIISLLKIKAEERRTAEASNTGSGNRGTYTPTPESIIEKVRAQGDPESEEEAEAWAKARMEQKLAKLKERRR